MKKSPASAALVLLTMAGLLVTSTLALNCYICNSLIDKDCDASVVPSEYLVNCSQGRTVGPDTVVVPDAKVCWKQSQDVSGLAIVDRTCGTKIEGNYYCYDRVGTNKVKVKYCVCNTDKCNSAGRFGAPPAWLVACALLALQLSSLAAPAL